jgi:hypothetical protein
LKTSLSLAETISLVAQMHLKAPVRPPIVTLELRREMSLCIGMTKLEPHIDETGRYLNIHQASQLVTGVSGPTLRNWVNEGQTKFGFKLRIKSLPVEHHRYYRKGEAGARRPLKERKLILEADVFALKEILHAAGRTEPGPWSPYEMAMLEARANALRRRERELGNLHFK